MTGRWAWKERDRDRPLAFGDAYLQGALISQVWIPNTALAHRDGVMQVSGLDLDRKGRMRARRVVFHVPWSSVTSWWRGEIAVPVDVTRIRPERDADSCEVVALRITGLGPPVTSSSSRTSTHGPPRAKRTAWAPTRSSRWDWSRSILGLLLHRVDRDGSTTWVVAHANPWPW